MDPKISKAKRETLYKSREFIEVSYWDVKI